MGERKVLNKYYPPDFDPAKIPRRKRPLDAQHIVRLMAPFSMRCNTCGEWIYKGKKFNARKENAIGEKYLSIQIFRFYIKCTRCAAEITFKTDPKNADYTCEHGASRNFEPWRDAEDAVEEAKREREKEEENNPMKHLENRTAETKREIDILDALDEMRSIRARQERVGIDAVLQQHAAEDVAEQVAEDEEDERLVRQAFGARRGDAGGSGGGGGGGEDYDDEQEVIEEIDLFELVKPRGPASASSAAASSSSSSSSAAPAGKPPKPAPPAKPQLAAATTAPAPPAKPADNKRKAAANPLGIVVKKKAV